MGQDLSLKQLKHKNEDKYFVISLVFSIIIYILLLVSIAGIPMALFIGLVSLYVNSLMLAHIRTNGVRLSAKQFPEVYEKVMELCVSMKISKVPDVYIMESSGILNAFAAKFSGKNMIVLYSEVFDLINTDDKDELAFVIAHELAHISRNHVVKQMLIFPALGSPLGKAYSRACEYTCDRMAAHYINNPNAAINGLTILAIGKSLYKKVDKNEYLLQNSMEKGFFTMLAEQSSTHPTLPKRMNEIQRYFGNEANSVNYFKKSNKTKIILLTVTVGTITLAWIGFRSVNFLFYAVENFMTEAFSEEGAADMIDAVARGDESKVKEFLDAGISPDIQDVEGWTPLMWAVQDGNIPMANLLIEAGADPDIWDYSENTALLLAIYQNNVDAISALAAAGADVNLADSTGWTPLMSAATYGYIESTAILLESGADPDMRDDNSYSAFLYAKKYAYNEVADMLK